MHVFFWLVDHQMVTLAYILCAALGVISGLLVLVIAQVAWWPIARRRLRRQIAALEQESDRKRQERDRLVALWASMPR